ncbi:MAG TPA: MFS transporter [Egicoccus sp.]|nr:MFS transporter [Egicoccus sp.]HSK22453.1 MFS transporter [Egicoccus sp.]
MTATATAPPGVGVRGDFGRLWLGAGASNLADGLLFAGLPVLALQVTDSPALIAGVAVAIQLPMALTALPSGVLADRYDRRRLLVAGNLLRVVGLLAAAVAVAVGELHLAIVYAVAALVGASEIVVDTTAQTAVPSLVARDDLGRAHARLGGTQVVMNDAVGAPIGSFLAGVGAAIFLATPLLLFALAAAFVLRLRLPSRARTERSQPLTAGLRSDLAIGVRYLAGNPLLRRLAVTACVFNFGNMAFVAVLPVYVTGPLGLPAAAYGLFLTGAAAGGVLGSLVADRVLRRLGLARVLRVASVLIALLFATIGLVPRLAVAVLAIVLAGALGMIWNVGSRVLRQTIVPDDVLGRVTATVAFVALIAAPVGGMLGGLVAEHHGVRWPAAVSVAAIAVVYALLRAVTADAIDAATADAAATHGPAVAD